jgi:trans-aconitate methyltransferase
MTNAAENVISLYQRHAADWAKDRGRILFEKAWLDRFISFLPSQARVVDVGCGSAEPIGRYLIEQGCAVTGIDSSAALIGMCRTCFPNQAWVVADMRSLSLENRFHGILAWDSFFHLCPDDQRGMFPIFRKHAAQQAVLMFTSGPRHGESIGTYRNEPLYHASLDAAEYRSLLDQQGFDVVLHAREDPDCGQHTVWLAKLR